MAADRARKAALPGFGGMAAVPSAAVSTAMLGRATAVPLSGDSSKAAARGTAASSDPAETAT